MGPVDELICAGDAIFQYRFSNEVIELLRERGARYILGNHELTFLSPAGAGARSDATVRADNLKYLASQPTTMNLQVSGRRLVIAHGSPFEPHDTYVYPASPLLSRMSELDADYVILGHTHHAMAVQVGRTVVINPGSAGDARDLGNGLDLSYAVLDTLSGEVRFKSYPDPARPHQLPRPARTREWPVRSTVPSEGNGRVAHHSRTLPPWIEEV
jgi:predicted phosphodiesterase